MASLRFVGAAIALALATPSHAESVADWRPYITEASLRFGVPTDWIERVIRAESNGQTTINGRPIRSRAGAMGLMQLMPATWEAMRRRLGLGTSPDNPRDNILAGTLYLRLMYDRFGYPGLFAAYNAGPGRYADHLSTGRRLPNETVTYLQTVGGGMRNPRAPTVQPPRERLFALQKLLPDGPTAPPPERPLGTLFVVRREGP